MVSVSWAHAENNFQAPLNNSHDLSAFEVWLSAASPFFCTLSRKPKEGVEAQTNALLSDLSSVYVVLKFECMHNCSILVQHFKKKKKVKRSDQDRAVCSGWLQNHDTYTAVYSGIKLKSSKPAVRETKCRARRSQLQKNEDLE